MSETRARQSWRRGDVEDAVATALSAAVGADAERMVRLACSFALRRHRVDLLVPHVAAVRALPVSDERDGVLAVLRMAGGDVAAALSIALASDATPADDEEVWGATSVRAATLVHIGLGALASGSWSQAERCAAAATAILDRRPDRADPPMRLDLLAIEAVAAAHTHGDRDASLALETALAPLRATNRLTSEHAFALICLGDVQHVQGALSQAAVNLSRGARLTSPDRPGFRAHALVSLAFIRIRQGRWDDAAAIVDTLHVEDDHVERDWIETQTAAIRGLLLMLRDDVAGAQRSLARAYELERTVPSYLASIVLLHARIVTAIARGAWLDLERHLDDAEEPGYRHPYRDGEWRALHLLASWHLGSIVAFRRGLSEWAEHPDAAMDPYYWAFTTIDSEHAGRHTDGLGAVERALETLSRTDDPLGVAWVRMVAGTFVSRYGDAGSPDGSRAITIYGAARGELRALGATAFADRCDAIAAAVEAEVAAARHERPASVLSAQQRRIALAVAQGYTSEEIASIEYITKRTVDYHVANIVRRLGVSSRREIARALSGSAPSSG